VTVYLIEKGTPAEVKFNIFKRINTGGLPLTSQEIRHALNQGKVTSYLKQLAESSEFIKATFGGVSDTRMVARECVLRFLAFTITAPEAYKAADFDAFLSEAMAALNQMPDRQLMDLRSRFIRSLEASYQIFGDIAFRKPKRKMKSPVNKALFEVWTVAMDGLTDSNLDLLKSACRTDVLQSVENLMKNDLEFLNAISQGTGNVAKVRLRFSRFKQAVEEALI
jgi:hypothetical protein